MVEYSKFFYNHVIHPCALCLCLQNYGWWVFDECPHSNQDIQANIETYHGVLKHLFALDTKGLKGC